MGSETCVFHTCMKRCKDTQCGSGGGGDRLTMDDFGRVRGRSEKYYGEMIR